MTGPHLTAGGRTLGSCRPATFGCWFGETCPKRTGPGVADAPLCYRVSFFFRCLSYFYHVLVTDRLLKYALSVPVYSFCPSIDQPFIGPDKVRFNVQAPIK